MLERADNGCTKSLAILSAAHLEVTVEAEFLQRVMATEQAFKNGKGSFITGME